MWTMKLINELFTEENLTLMRLVNVVPFLMAKTSKVRKKWLSLRNNDNLRSKSAIESGPSQARRVWMDDGHMKPTRLSLKRSY